MEVLLGTSLKFGSAGFSSEERNIKISYREVFMKISGLINIM